MLKRFRDLFGRCLPNINANCTNNCFSVPIHFIWGGHPFALFGQLDEELEGCPWWWAVVFPSFHCLSPSSGPCIPSIFGEVGAGLKPLFWYLLSSAVQFQGSLFALFILCVPLLGKYQMLLNAAQPWTACPVWSQFRLAGNSRPPAPEEGGRVKQSKDVWKLMCEP